MPTRIEQTQDGQFVAIVETPGRQPQKYYGKDHAEIILKIGKAQEDASKRILELKTSSGAADPVREVARFEGRNLSADEQFKLGQELGDPTKALAAIDRAIEARLGAAPQQIRETLARAEQAIARESYRQEGLAFMGQHPEFVASSENEQKMLAYLEAHNMGVTAKNFAIAYEDLKTDGLLEVREGGASPTPTGDLAANQPPGNTSTAGGSGEGSALTTTRPRAALTGIPGGRAVTGAATRRSGGLSDEEFVLKVRGMSASEYRSQVLNIPEAKARLDRLTNPPAPRT